MDAFWGYVVYKNGVFIGVLEREGFRPAKNADLGLREGDKVAITMPAGGG